MGTNSSKSESSYVTYSLIFINLAVFILTPLLSTPDFVVSQFGFHTPAFLSGDFYTLITSGFIHLDLAHLFWNMIFLWLFGRVVEEECGSEETFMIYLVGLILGNLSVMMTFPDIRVAGASGAVFSLVAAAILLTPMRPTLGLHLLPLALVGVFYLIPSFLNVFSLTNDVANVSHVGGAIGGAAIVFAKDWERAKKGLWVLVTFLVLFLALGTF